MDNDQTKNARRCITNAEEPPVVGPPTGPLLERLLNMNRLTLAEYKAMLDYPALNRQEPGLEDGTYFEVHLLLAKGIPPVLLRTKKQVQICWKWALITGYFSEFQPPFVSGYGMGMGGITFMGRSQMDVFRCTDHPFRRAFGSIRKKVEQVKRGESEVEPFQLDPEIERTLSQPPWGMDQPWHEDSIPWDTDSGGLHTNPLVESHNSH
ncbi:hypothetical protein F4808DRAFT_455686 [Astrocystis sublimbata]|nr:hypothetical protein F4808DRAFT_455686 [Astrocystis sublimbata]